MTKNTSLSIDELLALLKRLKSISIKPKEKTIFSIGGRGHYENPISDILAFFLNPNEDHELGALVAQAMLNCVGINASPNSIVEIHREYSTDEKKRLDLVIEGDDWLLAIENKVFHTANNPFEHYEQYLIDTFPKQKDKLHLVLLSPKNDQTEKWKSVGFTDLIEAIRSCMAEQILELPLNKWHFFLRDFLTNLTDLTGVNAMDDATFDVLQKNMSEIYRFEHIKKSFNEEVKQRGLRLLEESIPGRNFDAVQQLWSGDTPVYRFSCSDWLGETDVVLVSGFGTEKNTRVVIYLDAPELNKLNRTLVDAGFIATNSSEANNRWDCYEINCESSNVSDNLKLLVNIAKLVDDWHDQLKNSK